MPEPFDSNEYACRIRKAFKSLIRRGGNVAEISARMHLLTVAAERDLLRFAPPV